ncbi:MAG: hypothetical protein ACLR17_02605 [Enterobacteriaceae bacterium]
MVTALDADTGKARWRFDPHASTAEHVTCRGSAITMYKAMIR